MKTTLPTDHPVPPKTIRKDPFQRLSLAVKKLDQLINRANQLAGLSEQTIPQTEAAHVSPLPQPFHCKPRVSDSSIAD